MASRKAGTNQERESGVIDDRPTKRARVEDEDVLDTEEEDQGAPQIAPQASDLYLDTVSYKFHSIYTLSHACLADKSCQVRL